MLGQLVESDYLLDFDIFHVSHVTELLHYIDAKYLSSELGGDCNMKVDKWLKTQVNLLTTSSSILIGLSLSYDSAPRRHLHHEVGRDQQIYIFNKISFWSIFSALQK